METSLEGQVAGVYEYRSEPQSLITGGLKYGNAWGLRLKGEFAMRRWSLEPGDQDGDAMCAREEGASDNHSASHRLGRLDGESKSGYTNETRLITIKSPEGALRWAVTALCMRCPRPLAPLRHLPRENLGYY